MPPSRSSHSSHSSHSSFRSSSRSSFSSRSRSSSSFSRSSSSFSHASPSSRGSSSHGSSWSSSSFGNSRSVGRKSSFSHPSSPSPRSTTSHSSSWPSSVGSRNPDRRRSAAITTPQQSVFTPRPRVNQPRSGVLPAILHCLQHDYAYYPTSWECEGQQYEAGYYDESGNRYENVAFTDETGESTVEFSCEYCGTRAKYKWMEGQFPKCSSCGAPLSPRDVHTDAVIPDHSEMTDDAAITENSPRQKKRRTWLIIVAVFVLIWLYDSFSSRGAEYHPSTNGGYTTELHPAAEQIRIGEDIRLKHIGNSIYEIISSGNADKVLEYLPEDDYYYDSDTEAWLYYNTEMSPAVWQYWFEGFSSDYGDFGWMECEGKDWYVEASSGNWQKYSGSTASLWHIRNRFD